MSSKPESQKEKVLYVGDSRVKIRKEAQMPQDYTSYPGKSEAFIPNFLLKEWMVGTVFLVGFLVLTIAEPAPLGFPADPNNTAFIPIPDWYFLFLYQFLKMPYASGNHVLFGIPISGVLLGALAIPAVLFGGLFLAPFLDRGKERRFYKRPMASTFMVLTLISCTYLTVTSWRHYVKELEELGIQPEHIQREEKARDNAAKGLPTSSAPKTARAALVDKDDPGFEFYKKATCVTCHGPKLEGGGSIPSLTRVGNTYSADDILNVVKNGKASMPKMYETAKENGLSDQDITVLVNWLAKQKQDQ